ncbi:MAG: hypothetical protein BroJett011_48830 [Chloroflexota bacterium]|nr:MAG: hypothetical protein BroJett011_48830 [Chloroflexota bacterium]
MALDIKQVEYYNIIVNDHMADGSRLLSIIAGAGVSFHAFKAVPLGPRRTQFSLFPMDSVKMADGAVKAGLKLDGPYSALLIKGDEKSGALADIYQKLSQAGIQVDESMGIADINGGYGIVLHLKQEECNKAMTALNM